MEIVIPEINWLGILLATIAYSAFSGIWHRPFAFGKKWETAMGFTRPDNWAETKIYYIVPLIGCFLTSVTMEFLSTWLQIQSLVTAILLGFTLGFGIALPTTFTNAVIPIMKNPLAFGLITGMAHVISLTLVSVILYLV